MSFWKDALKVGLAPVTGGVSMLAGDDTLDKIPLVGAFTESDEEKALLAKQKEMAAEAKKRQAQMQQSGMNALGQRMLAFNPQNQMMAQMFGPEAAFTPQQFAQMVQNPMRPPPPDPSLINYQGTDPAIRAQVQQAIQAQQAFNSQEKPRQSMVANGIQQPGQGPAPLQQRRPQAARRF